MKKIVSLMVVTALAGLTSVASADLKLCGAATVPTPLAGTGECSLDGYGKISAKVSVQNQATDWRYSVNLNSTVNGSIGSGRLINSGGTFTRGINSQLCPEAKDTNKSSAVRGTQVQCITGPIGSLHFPDKIRVFLSRP